MSDDSWKYGNWGPSGIEEHEEEWDVVDPNGRTFVLKETFNIQKTFIIISLYPQSFS